MEEPKKYHGYGYHGGGRKKLDPADKKVFKTVSISGTPDEIARLKELAAENNKTVSRFILESLLK